MQTVQALLAQSRPLIHRSDAMIVLAYLLNVRKEYLIMHPEKSVDDGLCSEFMRYVHAIQDGYPVPYITGLQEFYGHSFRVDANTLIPRPDTETLVDLAIQTAQQLICQGVTPTILDMGTGSGCIAISLALALPQCPVWALDQSSKALLIAKDNAHRLGAHIQFIESNWFSALHGERFHLIVSNPPYIADGDSHLEALRFEPRNALTDFHDGLTHYRHIVDNAPAHLHPNGCLIFEHGYDQASAVRNLMCARGFYNVESIKDWGLNDRVTKGHWIG